VSTTYGSNALLRGRYRYITVRQVALEYNTMLGLNGNGKGAKSTKCSCLHSSIYKGPYCKMLALILVKWELCDCSNCGNYQSVQEDFFFFNFYNMHISYLLISRYKF